MDNNRDLCPLYHRAIELIGQRWTGAIIFVLLKGRCRYRDLRDAIPDISSRMLSARLKELEEESIIERHVLSETPVQVEYALTERGKALAQPVEVIMAWAHDWLSADDDRAQARGEVSA